MRMCATVLTGLSSTAIWLVREASSLGSRKGAIWQIGAAQSV